MYYIFREEHFCLYYTYICIYMLKDAITPLPLNELFKTFKPLETTSGLAPILYLQTTGGDTKFMCSFTL